jgi:putative oxygen-independent coproporphyrinogen III oxidase
MNEPLSFYIHIPYCVRRCGYCDFNTYTPAELQVSEDLTKISNNHIDLLIAEADQARASVKTTAPIPTIFFGGGTPTLMEPSDLKRVLRHLEDKFGFTPDIEITIEANPDTVSKEKLAALREIGINRISFGVQSGVDHVLKVLDRTHNPANVSKATNWAKEVGFDEISVDLIYGAPGESIEDWQTTIRTALELPITHISAYALIVEAGTKLAGQVKRGEIVIPEDDQTADKYLIADESFTKAGFTWYELSNWAKPGSECRHNIAYWVGANWWGLGPGAHSHVDGVRFWNVKHPAAYQERLTTGAEPIQEREILTGEQMASERLMLEIRLKSGIAKSSLAAEQIDALESFRIGGALDLDMWAAQRVALTQSGRLIADRIVREILL